MFEPCRYSKSFHIWNPRNFTNLLHPSTPAIQPLWSPTKDQPLVLVWFLGVPGVTVAVVVAVWKHIMVDFRVIWSFQLYKRDTVFFPKNAQFGRVFSKRYPSNEHSNRKKILCFKRMDVYNWATFSLLCWSISVGRYYPVPPRNGWWNSSTMISRSY